MTQDAAVNATHEADDTALRLAVAETRIEALHAMVEELQRARDSWQAQAERLALIAPTVIAAPGPAAAPTSEPEPRRSLLRYWFGAEGGGLRVHEMANRFSGSARR
jgi:hypothetical protein